MKMVRSVNFKEELETKTREADRVVRSFLPEAKGFPAQMIEAMNYSVAAGGKRIRPILVMEAFRMFGGRGDTAWPFMAAIEMVHTHSLIHDDLPAIDNDDYRRGKKTTHAVYGEALGILSGDALLNYAYETALSSLADGKQTDRKIRALRILANKSGVYGMLGGQSVDVQNEKMGSLSLSSQELDYIYLHKTSALLEASLEMGAVLAGAGEREAAAMEQIGRKTGLAFQIRDDILDVTGTRETLGKPVLSDAKNQKTTYVTLYGAEKAEEIVQELTGEAEKLLERLPGEKEFLCGLLEWMACREK